MTCVRDWIYSTQQARRNASSEASMCVVPGKHPTAQQLTNQQEYLCLLTYGCARQTWSFLNRHLPCNPLAPLLEIKLTIALFGVQGNRSRGESMDEQWRAAASGYAAQVLHPERSILDCIPTIDRLCMMSLHSCVPIFVHHACCLTANPW